MKHKNIILLHGWGASTKKLMPLKAELERLGWKVLVPKLPGFDAPEPDNPWTLNDYSSYVASKANEKWKNEKYYIFGHSFGGRIAIKSVLINNDKILGVVLCAAGGISRGNMIKRIMFYTISKIGKLFLIYKPLANLFKRFLYKIAREHDYEKSSLMMKQIMQNVIKEDLKSNINNISVDTLILWGKLDKVTPYKDALFLHHSLDGSKLISFDEEGHRLPYNKPKQIAKEINRWTS